LKEIILGLDPGLETTGYGFIQKEGNKLNLLEAGVIKTPRTLSFANRLLLLQTDLKKLLTLHSVSSCAIEKIFFSTNVKTAIAVAHARGVLIVTLAENKIPVAEYTPSQIKKSITGSGSADKKSVQRMLMTLLGLSTSIVQDDAADAVAMGLTHAMVPKSLRQTV
jgi:crossover junction endodeoxyribonuclease RuvC